MEDVLEVYRRPYDRDFPVVCMDEQPTQLVKETRIPVAMGPGRPARVDYEKVVLVCDNLNTHKAGSLYEVFPPEEARRLLERLEIHYTPKHGSWLNIAESELSVFTKQCLDRRLPDIETLRLESKAWHTERNGRRRMVDWQFTAEDARIKLKRLYPEY